MTPGTGAGISGRVLHKLQIPTKRDMCPASRTPAGVKSHVRAAKDWRMQ